MGDVFKLSNLMVINKDDKSSKSGDITNTPRLCKASSLCKEIDDQ
jgi:hypothetical protein